MAVATIMAALLFRTDCSGWRPMAVQAAVAGDSDTGASCTLGGQRNLIGPQWWHGIMLVVGIIQTVASVILSLVGIMVAYLIYKIQRDRNTPKLVLVTGELLEDDEREEACYAVRILNVGLVPAVNVRILVDIEEWQGGREIRSKFHEEGYSAFSDTIPLLDSQESRLYEQPTPEDKSYMFTVVVTCRDGIGNRARYLTQGNSSVPESDAIAFQHVKAGRSAAFRKLKSLGRTGDHRVSMVMGANSLKDYNELFGRAET